MRCVKIRTHVLGPPRPEPTAAERLVRDIDGILGPKATLPDDLDRWLIGPITENERAAVYQALDRLGGRIENLKRSIS